LAPLSCEAECLAISSQILTVYQTQQPNIITKTGHPKAACTVKIVAADNDKSTKFSASKVSSLTGSKADVGKMFTLINKTFKTMGKAMSQVSKEIGAFADDGSIGAQSQALVDRDSIYAFMIGTSMMRECLLLNNQSLVHVFCN
jgi:hypothetical protein